MRTAMLLLLLIGAAVATMWACRGFVGPAATPTTLPAGSTTTTTNTTSDFFDLAALRAPHVDHNISGQAPCGNWATKSPGTDEPAADGQRPCDGG